MKTADQVLDTKEFSFSDSHEIEILREDCIEAMQQYAEQFKPKWISVTESLPKPGTDVLILKDLSKWNRGKHIYKASVHLAEKPQSYGGPNSLTGRGYLTGVYFAIPAICNPDTITHWMPLPEPPTE